jgi:hypothetical protein
MVTKIKIISLTSKYNDSVSFEQHNLTHTILN